MITAYESWTDGDLIGIRSNDNKLEISADIGQLLRFLRYSASQTIRVAWDMDEFIAPILRKLPTDILDRLSRFDDQLTYQGHELYYLPERMFRVGKARFYGIRDFWGPRTDEKPTLGTAHTRATELMSTLEALTLGRPNGQPIRKLTSPIAVFEDSEWGQQVYRSLPRGSDLPPDTYGMLEYASRADGKDWVSNHWVGHFNEGEIWDYDLQSCYPSIAATLPDLRDMTIWKSTKLGSREMSAAMGVAQGRFTINPAGDYAHCSPIMGSVGDLPGNPLGKLPEDRYTLDEIRFVQDYGIGAFKMRDGWFAELNTTAPRYPLQPIMETLFCMRVMLPLADPVAKAISNSLIGKMIETRADRVFGVLRNDLYHAIITARARVQVAKFLVDNNIRTEELICIQTDGVKLTRYIPLMDNGMGNWINKGSSPTIILSPYKVYNKDARPYRITYNDIIKLVSEHPLSQRYTLSNPHRLTLVQAIRTYEDATRVGEIIQSPTSVDLITLSAEQNRVFPKLPTTGRALLSNKYPSTPFILS